MNYGFAINTRTCIGCHACSTACKSENQVPIGVNRTWVKYTETGTYPDSHRHFQVTRCNHCANPPCVRSCPTTAMYQKDNGIVEFDADVCIGCKACIQACPYDAIYIDPDSHTAAKCHFCGHRLEVGLEPACVVVCPEQSIVAGDLDDPQSKISKLISSESVTVRKPEQGTAPNLFYIEGNEVSLHPSVLETNAETFMWADRTAAPRESVAAKATSNKSNFRGDPIRTPQSQGLPSNGPVQLGQRTAGHMVQVAYNAQHKMYWHWPIPFYILTKAIAAGVFILLGLSSLLGYGAITPNHWLSAGGIAIGLLFVTVSLLVYDLERPERFLYLFIRPQWRSWVARAAWILSGFFTLATLWWLAEMGPIFGLWESPSNALRMVFAFTTLPLALMTGVYTAFLFAQAEGRDMWQSSVTPLHMGVQTFYLGACGLIVSHLFVPLTAELYWLSSVVLTVGLILSALMIFVGEFGVSRASENASLAVHEIRRGRYRVHFWWGGISLGHVVPLLLTILHIPYGMLFAAIAASAGVFLYEYAYVMAPQRIANS